MKWQQQQMTLDWNKNNDRIENDIEKSIQLQPKKHTTSHKNFFKEHDRIDKIDWNSYHMESGKGITVHYYIFNNVIINAMGLCLWWTQILCCQNNLLYSTIWMRSKVKRFF